MKNDAVAIAVLEYAMRNERLGYRFYMMAIEATKDEKGKKVFHSIATEELEHLNILQKEVNSLKKGGDWVDLDETRDDTPAPHLTALFPEEEEEVEAIIKKRASDLDALDIALDLEHRGYKLYQDESKRTNNSTARAIYQYLASEENKHFTILQKTRNYLATNGEWLWDDMQSPMLDG